jgi:ABC-type transporter Mla MlaB component
MRIDVGGACTCNTEQENGRRLVRIEGELGIAAVDDVRRVFVEVLTAGENATVTAAGLAAADLAGLQLLCSAHRSFRERGLSFEVQEMPEQLRLAAKGAGFDGRCSTCRYRDETCLWTA